MHKLEKYKKIYNFNIKILIFYNFALTTSQDWLRAWTFLGPMGCDLFWHSVGAALTSFLFCISDILIAAAVLCWLGTFFVVIYLRGVFWLKSPKQPNNRQNKQPAIGGWRNCGNIPLQRARLACVFLTGRCQWPPLAPTPLRPQFDRQPPPRANSPLGRPLGKAHASCGSSKNVLMDQQFCVSFLGAKCWTVERPTPFRFAPEPQKAKKKSK